MVFICVHVDACIKRPKCIPPIYNHPPKLSNLCPVKRIIQHKFIEIKSPWVCYYLPTMHFPAASECIQSLPHPSLSYNIAIIFSLSSLGNSEQVKYTWDVLYNVCIENMAWTMKIPYNKQGNVTKQTKLCTEQYYVYSNGWLRACWLDMGFKGTLQMTAVLVLGPVSSQKEQRMTSILTLLLLQKSPFNSDWLHYSAPNLHVRFPLIKFLQDKRHECPIVLRKKGASGKLLG